MSIIRSLAFALLVTGCTQSDSRPARPSGDEKGNSATDSSLNRELGTETANVSTDSSTETGRLNTDSSSDIDSRDEGENDAGNPVDPSVDNGDFCSEQQMAISYVPAKLMIALDMSGSMAEPSDRYPIAVDAIVNMLSGFSGRFLFGFDTYPDRFDRYSCRVDEPIWFDCAPDNERNIINWLRLHRAVQGPGDPLLLEMGLFFNELDYAPNFTTDALPGPSYLLLVADGDDCCGPTAEYDCDQNWSMELADVTQKLLAKGIMTIVVGYTESADADTLDLIAKNGGTIFDETIPALDQLALEDALTTIANSIVSCNFDISDPGPRSDPSRVNFYLDNQVVPFDAGCVSGTGWTWQDDSHDSMRFCKQACSLLQQGDIDLVTAKFGCPVVVV